MVSILNDAHVVPVPSDPVVYSQDYEAIEEESCRVGVTSAHHQLFKEAPEEKTEVG